MNAALAFATLNAEAATLTNDSPQRINKITISGQIQQQDQKEVVDTDIAAHNSGEASLAPALLAIRNKLTQDISEVQLAIRVNSSGDTVNCGAYYNLKYNTPNDYLNILDKSTKIEIGYDRDMTSLTCRLSN